MSAKGFATKIAVGKETVWGTPVVVSQKIPVTSEGLSKEFQRVSDNILGSDGIQRAESTQESTSGSLELEMTYTGLDEILEIAMGSKAGTGTSTDPYRFTLTEDIDKSLTVAIDKQVSVHEFAGAKINQMTIQGSSGDTLKISLDILAKKKNRGTSATNTALDIDNASGYGNRIIFSDCSLSIGGNPVIFASFNLQLNNNLTAIFENKRQPVEISRNGKREVSLTIELSRYTSDTFNDYFDLEAEVPVIITATDGTSNFEINIPRTKVIKTSDSVGGAEMIKQTIEFTVLRTDTTPEFEIRRY